MKNKYLIVSSQFTGDDLSAIESKIETAKTYFDQCTKVYNDGLRKDDAITQRNNYEQMVAASIKYSNLQKTYAAIKSEIENATATIALPQNSGLLKTAYADIKSETENATATTALLQNDLPKLTIDQYDEQIKSAQEEYQKLLDDYIISQKEGLSSAVSMYVIDNKRKYIETLKQYRTMLYPVVDPNPAISVADPNPGSSPTNPNPSAPAPVTKTAYTPNQPVFIDPSNQKTSDSTAIPKTEPTEKSNSSNTLIPIVIGAGFLLVISLIALPD